MKRSRAFRRLQAEKKKAFAKKHILPKWGFTPHDPNWNKHVGKIAQSRAFCSCPMCGNPRHYNKGVEEHTIQEQRTIKQDRADQHYQHQEEYENDTSFY